MSLDGVASAAAVKLDRPKWTAMVKPLALKVETMAAKVLVLKRLSALMQVESLEDQLQVVKHLP